jgi:hypothetical protein
MIGGVVCGGRDFLVVRWGQQGTEPSGQISIVQVFIEERLDRGTEITAAIGCYFRLVAHHLALPPQRTLHSDLSESGVYSARRNSDKLGSQQACLAPTPSSIGTAKTDPAQTAEVLALKQ